MSAVRNFLLNRFNYGILSSSALARTDLTRGVLGASMQTNVIGKRVGSAIFRPGLQYKGTTLNNAAAKHIPFVFSLNDKAAIEITDQKMRVLIDDVSITRPSVTTTITNGTFTSDLSGWTDIDQTGATSYWSGGYMVLSGTGDSAAKRYQQVSVTGGNVNTKHAIRFTVNRGPVTIRIGSSLGGDDYVNETVVESDGYGEGVYSFSFTPSGDFYIEVSNRSSFADSLIDKIEIETTSDFSLTLPYVANDLSKIRYEQSGNVLYLACDGYKQKKIIRFGTESWGVSDYSPSDGPFKTINTTATTMTPSGLTGQITLTSSVPYFNEDMEGALFKLTSNGQKVQSSLSTAGDVSGYVKITGVDDARKFSVVVTGTWSGTLQIQRSIAEPGAWAASGLTSITGNGASTYDDGADNSIYYYRVLAFTGFSGTAEVTITTGQGSITGIVRALDYTSSTEMICSVLKDLGGTDATDLWSEGEWSDHNGYPTAVVLHEGRLWLAGRDKLWGSASNAYESFDDEIEGDSGPLNENLGSGPIDVVNALLSLGRLVAFCETSERVARSTSLDEPITPTNFSIKIDSTRGSSNIQPVVVDNGAFFARGKSLFYYGASDRIDGSYRAKEVTLLAPEVGESGFVHLAVQRYPDTRIHALRDDGKVVLYTFDLESEVECLQLIETDGVIEDIYVFPSGGDDGEDEVYYVVNRTINGSTVRYREKWALESDCIGGTLNKQADSFVVLSPASATLSGLSHLEGEEVVVWADGKDYSTGYGNTQTTYTVSSGSITLSESVNSAIVGLPYTGKWKSVKLQYQSQNLSGEPLTQRKLIKLLAIIGKNLHNKGVRFGQNFTTMDYLPRIENGVAVDSDHVWEEYDLGATTFPGSFSHDPRLCLEMQAPRPAEILGVVIGLQINDRT